jgi:predicted permease
VGLGYKLLICPGLVIALFWLLDVEASPASRVSVIEAAMPPMIGAAVVATQYKLAPRLTSLLVGLGIPLGLFTASAWFWLFGAITR